MNHPKSTRHWLFAFFSGELLSDAIKYRAFPRERAPRSLPIVLNSRSSARNGPNPNLLPARTLTR